MIGIMLMNKTVKVPAHTAYNWMGGRVKNNQINSQINKTVTDYNKY